MKLIVDFYRTHIFCNLWKLFNNPFLQIIHVVVWGNIWDKPHCMLLIIASYCAQVRVSQNIGIYHIDASKLSHFVAGSSLEETNNKWTHIFVDLNLIGDSKWVEICNASYCVLLNLYFIPVVNLLYFLSGVDNNFNRNHQMYKNAEQEGGHE